MNPVRIEHESDVAVVIVDNPPVNALSTAVRAGLLQAFRDLAADPDSLGIVIMGAGRDFIAGADIREMNRPPLDPSLPEVLARMDRVDKPIVAAISGSALGERGKLAAGALSGGQQQMLAIGRALMARPKLLLLDEPSMGLSPVLADRILDTVLRLRQDGVTILLVEQNAQAALGIADRAYVLETGTVTHSGTGAALLDDPRMRAAYLGV